MDRTGIDAIAAELDRVTGRTSDGVRSWRYRGRLVARELDDHQLVIRASFDARDDLLSKHPETFSVPKRFAKHMMVVADLSGDADVIEDALTAAWALQAGND